MSEPATLPADLRYQDALEALNTILAEIEGEGADLDKLADQVERAALLIAFCRKRITDTEMSVKRVFDAMAQQAES